MAMTLHSASVPIFLTMLGNLSGWIDKAVAHAAAKQFDPETLMGVRLAPDMLPFGRQVQIACDAAKYGASRPAGIEAPVHPDDETTLTALKARIAATQAFLRGITPEQMESGALRPVSVPVRGRDPLQYESGEQYLKQFALPNFFFHVTTAYALLRHNGIDLGKRDYLGRV